jgi:hypothetical protein
MKTFMKMSNFFTKRRISIVKYAKLIMKLEFALIGEEVSYAFQHKQIDGPL